MEQCPESRPDKETVPSRNHQSNAEQVHVHGDQHCPESEIRTTRQHSRSLHLNGSFQLNHCIKISVTIDCIFWSGIGISIQQKFDEKNTLSISKNRYHDLPSSCRMVCFWLRTMLVSINTNCSAFHWWFRLDSAYSPDTAPYDFHTFPGWKMILQASDSQMKIVCRLQYSRLCN